MPLNDAAVLSISTGNFYTGAVGAALPTDFRNPGTDYTDMGHTSIKDVLTTESEGGDVTTLGTLQNKTLRTSTSPRVETFQMILNQYDTQALKFYYGANANVNAAGLVEVPANPTPVVASFLTTFYDGENTLVIWAPRAEISRSDSFDLGGDGETLASLPISVRPLQFGSNTFPYVIGIVPVDSGE